MRLSATYLRKSYVRGGKQIFRTRLATKLQQKKGVLLPRKRQIRNLKYQMKLPYIYTSIHLFAKKTQNHRLPLKLKVLLHGPCTRQQTQLCTFLRVKPPPKNPFLESDSTLESIFTCLQNLTKYHYVRNNQGSQQMSIHKSTTETISN